MPLWVEATVTRREILSRECLDDYDFESREGRCNAYEFDYVSGLTETRVLRGSWDSALPNEMIAFSTYSEIATPLGTGIALVEGQRYFLFGAPLSYVPGRENQEARVISLRVACVVAN